MRPRKLLTVGAIAVAGLLLLYGIFKFFSSDEEAPIIVKNGSMDVIAGDNAPRNYHWKWSRRNGGGNPVFIHDAAGPYGNDDPARLQVLVMGHPVGGCESTTEGDTVKVTFDDGFSILASRVRVGSSGNYRTHVEASASALDEVTGTQRPTLRHGSSGSGHIVSVTVGSAAPCTFPNRDALTRICISPDDPAENCDEN